MNPTIKIRNVTIGGNERVKLMAAVNLSKESFYKGSIIDYSNKTYLENHFTMLLNEGSDFIDFGLKSSAPKDIYGKETVISPQEEIKRLKLPLKVLRDLNQECLISIDTQSSEVAEYALTQGADIINDISGLQTDPNLIKIIGDQKGFVILMAAKKSPGDVFKKENILQALQTSINKALDYIPKKNIIIDPGVGGWVSERTPEDDFRLILDTLEIKKTLQAPVLLGLSRKSFIGKTLDLPPDERLPGSLAATAISILYGADIIRTHDIRETLQAVRIAEVFKNLLN